MFHAAHVGVAQQEGGTTPAAATPRARRPRGYWMPDGEGSELFRAALAKWHGRVHKACLELGIVDSLGYRIANNLRVLRSDGDERKPIRESKWERQSRQSFLTVSNLTPESFTRGRCEHNICRVAHANHCRAEAARAETRGDWPEAIRLTLAAQECATWTVPCSDRRSRR